MQRQLGLLYRAVPNVDQVCQRILVLERVVSSQRRALRPRRASASKGRRDGEVDVWGQEGADRAKLSTVSLEHRTTEAAVEQCVVRGYMHVPVWKRR